MRLIGFLILLASISFPVFSAMDVGSPTVIPTPERKAEEGKGPYERLIIRNAMVVDGTGAPPVGPMDIVIEGNRITEMVNVTEQGAILGAVRPGGASEEIDANGGYVLPGLVNVHVHSPVFWGVSAEYAYKLWLAHGVTTVRGVPAGPLEWAVEEKNRSAKNEIVAPRLVVYQGMGFGNAWKGRKVLTPEDARKWVRYAKKQGVDGVKTYGLSKAAPEVSFAAWDEAKKQGMGSLAHLGQMEVAAMNARDAAEHGLSGMTHFYGLFESLYKDHDLQPFPTDYNYDHEEDRFGQVARQWKLVHERGSKEWQALLDEFLKLDFYMSPTFEIYNAGRDLMRAQHLEWLDKYTLPVIAKSFETGRSNHMAYFFDWTTADEVAWKKFYQVWMDFVNDYKNLGGKVTFGTDAGFSYSLYGFSAIGELELLQEAGFHPLEVIRSATMYSAMEIAKPSGKAIEYGVLRPGMLADMLIVDQNPLQNFKVLYGTGTQRYNFETKKMERVGGVRYTIKDGIVYDAKELLAEVAEMVAEEKINQEKGVRQ